LLSDRYDNPISTSSASARDFYVTAIDKLLEGAPHVTEAFEAVVEEAPRFAPGHAGLARVKHATGNVPAARAAIEKARELSAGTTDRETSHINTIALLAEGKAPQGFRAVLDHIAHHPRDAMIAQTTSSIFGLIGFSGLPGRESELLADTDMVQGL